MLKTVNFSNFNNSWFYPGKNILIRIFWYYTNAIIFKSYIFPFSNFKIILLKLFGAKVGTNCLIKPNVNIKYPWNLTMGNYVWIGENAWIDNLTLVEIGNNVCLSQSAYLFTGNHNYKMINFDLIINKIVLEDGVWIGANSIVTPGVICKTHSVLAAGSIATKSTEAYGIYQGSPAIFIRKRVIQG